MNDAYEKVIGDRMEQACYRCKFIGGDPIGYCSEECPQHSGKMCEITGNDARDRICEPWARDVSILARQTADRLWNASFTSAFSLWVYHHAKETGALPRSNEHYDRISTMARIVADNSVKSIGRRP